MMRTLIVYLAGVITGLVLLYLKHSATEVAHGRRMTLTGLDIAQRGGFVMTVEQLEQFNQGLTDELRAELALRGRSNNEC